MRVEDYKVVLRRERVTNYLCFSLSEIAHWAREDDDELEKSQCAFFGAVEMFDLSPNDRDVLMRPVRNEPTKASITAAYEKIAELFGSPYKTLKEVLGHGWED